MYKILKGKNGGNRYVFPVMGNLDSSRAFLDATRSIFEAEVKDKELGYASGDGPNKALEVCYAEQYAKFVSDNAVLDNLDHFETKQYRIFKNEEFDRA